LPLIFCLDHLSPDLSVAQHFFFFFFFICSAQARLENRAKTRTVKQQFTLTERVGFVLFLARADAASVGCGEQYPSGKNK